MANIAGHLKVPVLLAVSALPTIQYCTLTEVNLHALRKLVDDLFEAIYVYDQQSFVCSLLNGFFAGEEPAIFSNFIEYFIDTENCFQSFLKSYNTFVKRPFDLIADDLNEIFFATVLERSHEFEMILANAEENSDRVMCDCKKLKLLIDLIERKVPREVFFKEMKLVGIDLNSMNDPLHGNQESDFQR